VHDDANLLVVTDGAETQRRWVADSDGAQRRLTDGTLVDFGHGEAKRGAHEQRGSQAKLLRRSKAARRSPESTTANAAWRCSWHGCAPARSSGVDAVEIEP
jgi:hypothetical protein